LFGGLFDEYPRLKIILGHLGEALPFWLWRVDNKFPARLAGKLKRRPSEYFKANFFVTTSGNCWHPPFLCTCLALGADNIFFAVDYPFDSSDKAVQFMDSAPISDSDREKIYHLNAEKLFSL